MLSIPCDHPDLEEFISIKSDLNAITKANISIRITDEFMRAVKNKENFKLSFTREQTGEVIEKLVYAPDIFHKLCEMNWDYAEPGILFWDRIEGWNLLSEDPEFHYAGTNPCAEEPLPSGGSCLLGSLNLAEFVCDDKDGNPRFNFIDFYKSIRIAVKALNDVLDEGLPLHPLQEQRDSVRGWRQIGLGIMGLADMLIKKKIRYGSKESIELCDNIGNCLASAAIETSSKLAKDHGKYPRIDGKAVFDSDFFIAHTDENIEELFKKNGLRNSQLLTIAPTGSLSTMLGISGGIEPIFANYYTRKTESLHGKDEYYKVWTPIVKEYVEKHDIQDENELPDYFVTAKNIDYRDRIEMQSVWQNHIDASISSTVNVPNNFTVEQVENLYMLAWEKGLKGVTIFREGCKRMPILDSSEKKDTLPAETSVEAVGKEDKTEEMIKIEFPRGAIIKVDDNVIGKKRSLRTGCGTLHCEAFFDPVTGELRETYLSKGSSGGCQNFMIGVSRLASLAARGGVSVYDIVDQLKSCGTCPSYAVRTAVYHDTSKGSSCPVAVGNALIDMYEEMAREVVVIRPDDVNTSQRLCTAPEQVFDNKVTSVEEDVKNDSSASQTPCESDFVPLYKDNKPTCPECGGYLVFSGGCLDCKDCGWSKCD